MTLPNPTKNTGKQTMPESTRPNLRDCPFCHASGSNDELVNFTRTVAVGHDCEWDMGYSIFCSGCGSEVNDEYKDVAVRLWNGEPREVQDDA